LGEVVNEIREGLKVNEEKIGDREKGHIENEVIIVRY
jgi:hypothetical protein